MMLTDSQNHVVHGPARVRAVALRIEGLDQRWQATSFSML